MSQFGPVIGNRIADANKTAPKPHLRERLAQQSCRNTPMGTLTMDTHKRQSFVPNYLRNAWGRIEADFRPEPRPVLRPGQRVRIDATVSRLLEQEGHPLKLEEAAVLAGQEGTVIAHSGCASLGLVLVMLAGVPWAFVPAYLQPVTPAESNDKLAAMADYTSPF